MTRAKAGELREVIEELGKLDARRGYLRAQLEHLLKEEPPVTRPTLVETASRRLRSAGRPAGAQPPSTTPGLRTFIEQTAARKGLDLKTISRGDVRDEAIAKYPGVEESILVARISNHLKSLRTAVARDEE